MILATLVMVAVEASQWAEMARRRRLAAAGAVKEREVPTLKRRIHQSAVACLALALVRCVDPVGQQGHYDYDTLTFLGNNLSSLILCSGAYVFLQNIAASLRILGGGTKRVLRAWTVATRALIALTLVLANALLLARLRTRDPFLTDGLLLWWNAALLCVLVAELWHCRRLLRAAASRYATSPSVSSSRSIPALRAAAAKIGTTLTMLVALCAFMVPLLLVGGYSALRSEHSDVDDEYGFDLRSYSIRNGLFFAGQLAGVAIMQQYAWIGSSAGAGAGPATSTVEMGVAAAGHSSSSARLAAAATPSRPRSSESVSRAADEAAASLPRLAPGQYRGVSGDRELSRSTMSRSFQGPAAS